MTDDLGRTWLVKSALVNSDEQRASVVLDRVPDEPCSCGDTGWTDDENWQVDLPGVPQERVHWNGLIPCGFCNPGGRS